MLVIFIELHCLHYYIYAKKAILGFAFILYNVFHMNPERAINFESKEGKAYEYDAVIVLGGGLHSVKTDAGAKYFPTNYDTRTGKGSGGIRVAASLELYLQKKAKRFIFSGGRNSKTLEKHGPAAPSEAEVFSDKFTRVLAGLKNRSDYTDRFNGLESPVIGTEDLSTNTFRNLEHTFREIKKLNLKKVAILTSDYHIPRTQALLEEVRKELGLEGIEVIFISAEEFMKDSQPGKYDKIIEEIYSHPFMEERLKAEAQGVQDLREGKYKK